ncbi:MAG: LPXTG cell wall anchor domain-containing protein [Clostridia bacterium]|nr:LPXTG cell wall anchor domain-containing protein [Clostridia bacterium]
MVAGAEMPNTGDGGYAFRIIAFMVLLLTGTLLIFWKYKLQEDPVKQE